LKKIAHDNGMADDNTSVRPLLFCDGFKICNIKHNNLIEDIKTKMLMIFNEATSESYNHIKKKRYSITISKINYYTDKVGIHTTDLEKYTKEKKDFSLLNINMLLISGTSGTGKTSIAKQVLKHQNLTKNITIYTPKPEDYKGYENVKSFEEQDITELINKLKLFNENKASREAAEEIILLDEFYLLVNLKISKQLIEEINKCLAFNRASRLKIFAITQSINKSMLNGFNIALANTMLLNLPDIQNYTSSIGDIPAKFRQKLPTGKFLKFSIDEPMEVLMINDPQNK
jgi:hypothetical protein